MDWNRLWFWCGLNLIAGLPTGASAVGIYLSPKPASRDFSLLLADPNFAFYFIMISYATVVDMLLHSWRRGGVQESHMQRSIEPSPWMVAVLIVLIVMGAYGLVLYGVSVFGMPPRLLPLAKRASAFTIVSIVILSVAGQVWVCRKR